MASMLDIAYDYIDKAGKEVVLSELWGHIVTVCEYSEETAKAKLPRFFSNLMIDGRFITLGENLWDLKDRHTFDESHIDTGEDYRAADEEKSDDESGEEKEKDEY